MSDSANATVGTNVANSLGRLPSPVAIPDVATYFYIKRIKKSMECPGCHERLLFDEGVESWVCEGCGFTLPEEEFLDDYVFWFCDQCNESLNTQAGFDRSANCWVCANCGFENTLTEEDLLGICQDCDALLEDPDATLCPECERARLRRIGMQNRLEGLSDNPG